MQDVAELLQCEVTTVQELLRRGQLPGLKFGRAWIVPSEPLLQYLNQMALAEATQRRNDREPVRPTAVFVGNSKQKREPPKLPNL
ncbi:MAG: helix-turn-helix domain-containing protein [Rhodoferax sp.]|nr:helix-turn-helix domain-containing protein [Rhodoferax sp.]